MEVILLSVVSGSLSKTNDAEVLSNLIDSDEKAVNIVSQGARVQCLLVLLDLHLDKLSHLFNLGKNSVLVARQTLHEPGKDVVHLWEGSTQHTAALFLEE